MIVVTICVSLTSVTFMFRLWVGMSVNGFSGAMSVGSNFTVEAVSPLLVASILFSVTAKFPLYAHQ